MFLFYIATLTPIPLIALAAIHGGAWAIAAFVYMNIVTGTLDELVKRVSPERPESEFPAADGLSAVLAVGHLGLIFTVVWGLSHAAATWWSQLLAFIAAVQYFGQVSNSNAHELIHRPGKVLRNLGMWVYISMLYGQHTSAHVLVHHRHVATDLDPNSARIGESFYSFFARAWPGEFMAGLRAETERYKRINRSLWRHPYVIYVGGGVVFIASVGAVMGAKSALTYVMLCFFAQAQLLMADYIQHYGLRRQIIDGRPEPVSDMHSWNSPHWFSSALMLNAPRHSDHHAHPGKLYPALRLGKMPMLPRSLPVMALIAFFPGPWRKLMDRRAEKWQLRAQEARLAVTPDRI